MYEPVGGRGLTHVNLRRARREIEELRLFIRQLANVSPRGDNWERSYNALRERVQRLLETA